MRHFENVKQREQSQTRLNYAESRSGSRNSKLVFKMLQTKYKPLFKNKAVL